MPSFYRRLLSVFWFGLAALVITAYGQGVWGALVVINLRISPGIPWAVGVMALFLWLMWQYLGGRWWPRRTSNLRRSLLRANPVSGRVFGWSLLAGASLIVALSGCWIVLFQLVRTPANATSDVSGYPLLTVALVLADVVASCSFLGGSGFSRLLPSFSGAAVFRPDHGSHLVTPVRPGARRLTASFGPSCWCIFWRASASVR